MAWVVKVYIAVNFDVELNRVHTKPLHILGEKQHCHMYWPLENILRKLGYLAEPQRKTFSNTVIGYSIPDTKSRRPNGIFPDGNSNVNTILVQCLHANLLNHFIQAVGNLYS